MKIKVQIQPTKLDHGNYTFYNVVKYALESEWLAIWNINENVPGEIRFKKDSVIYYIVEKDILNGTK